MPRVATLSLRDHAGDELLTELARLLLAPREASFVRGWDDGEAPAQLDPAEEERERDLALDAFRDWDHHRGDGWGFFSSDRRECASRRVDLRGPTDLDPG